MERKRIGLVLVLIITLMMSACGNSKYFSESTVIKTINGKTEASITQNEHFVKIYVYDTEEDIDAIAETKIKEGFSIIIQNANKSFDVKLNSNLFVEQDEFDLINKFILSGKTGTNTKRSEMINIVKEWLQNRN